MNAAVTILIRVANPSPRWERWSAHATVERAEQEYEERIRDRGITAWTWIGPTPEAKKMLADPYYMPPEQWPERAARAKESK